ncbi:hypothetical protein GJ496_004365 [Pomphorhynchus laevis]|nr:hypothetical protein GJ496_004365 [Pomphorhynchus laevis]
MRINSSLTIDRRLAENVVTNLTNKFGTNIVTEISNNTTGTYALHVKHKSMKIQYSLIFVLLVLITWLIWRKRRMIVALIIEGRNSSPSGYNRYSKFVNETPVKQDNINNINLNL